MALWIEGCDPICCGVESFPRKHFERYLGRLPGFDVTESTSSSVFRTAVRSIASIASPGVPVGIWRNFPVEGTAYGAVTCEAIPQLLGAIEKLYQFDDSYAADLSERLFREASTGGKRQGD